MSPRATSSPGSILIRGLACRSKTRTRYLAARSALAIAEPTKPLAPVTKARPSLPVKVSVIIQPCEVLAYDPRGGKKPLSQLGPHAGQSFGRNTDKIFS